MHMEATTHKQTSGEQSAPDRRTRMIDEAGGGDVVRMIDEAGGGDVVP